MQALSLSMTEHAISRLCAAPPQRAGNWIVREVEEAEEWVVEGASHGLADTTCFELYGFPNQAPPLSDSPNSKAQVSF